MPKARLPPSRQRKRSVRSHCMKNLHIHLNNEGKKTLLNTSETCNSRANSLAETEFANDVIVGVSSTSFEEDMSAEQLDEELPYILEKDPNPPKSIEDLLLGRRLVNLGYVLRCYQKVVLHSTVCTMGKMNFVREVRRGLFSSLHFFCDNCEKKMYIHSDPPSNSSREKDINTRVVWGAISIGIGHSQCEELFGLLDVPTLTSKTFSQNSKKIGERWEDHLQAEIIKNGQAEKKIAIDKGHFTSDGKPYITVIGDGGWAKRTYGHGYNSSSGVGFLLGAETKKPLFLGIKNKTCSMCSFYKSKNQEVKSHCCFMNFSGPSTAMEQRVIVEGFMNSIEQHDLVYKYYIGDGDSNVYAKIVETVPYGRDVIKIECANHMTRGVCSKLHKLETNTTFPLTERKLMSTKVNGVSRTERLVKGVRMAIKEAGLNKDVNQLRKDLENAPNHVFGKHSGCRDSYCKRKSNEELDLTPQVEKCGLMQEVKKVLFPLIQKADRLAFNETTNQAERYMSLLAKFSGGKRVNFTKRGEYHTRAHGAALSYIYGPSWHMKTWHNSLKFGSIATKLFVKKGVQSQKRKALRLENGTVKKRRKDFSGPDRNYGPEAAQPDMMEAELNEKCSEYLNKLKEQFSTVDKCKKVEKETRDQHLSETWRETRKKLLTASNFGRIVKRRAKTHCHNLIKQLLYGREFSNSAILYGREKEKEAIEKYRESTSAIVARCGLFINPQYPFLGASPDGLVGDDGLIEVKSFPSIGNNKFINCRTKSTCFEIVDNKVCLKKNHNFYFQIQGQMNICGRDFCDLIMISDNDYVVQRIQKDSTFWEQKMLPKLELFYKKSMLPEIIDPRITRGMKIRG